MIDEKVMMPEHYILEQELREQLSGRPGHQRCIVGRDELLLVLHEVPEGGVPEREALLFWKRHDGNWEQSSGPGLGELRGLLERYEKVIDRNEEILEKTESAEDIFRILRQAGPLARSTRNLVIAIEQALVQEPDDKEIRAFRDRARELERAAELLQSDARETMMYWQAEASEEHARSAERLGNILFKLNLVTGFFLPLVALGGLFGMNVKFPGFVDGMFWWILFGGLVIGGLLLRYVSVEKE